MILPKRFLFSLLAMASLHSALATDKDRPNILWITSEDNGVSWISCYGGTNAQTPAIDQLAKEGFRYLHGFDNAAVCAPTRSCWITGMYGISNGTQPMRSRNEIPHDQINYYPDLLKARGYHTSNPAKTDYNIGGRPDKDCWDYKGGKGNTPYGWRVRKDGQPFFAVVNFTDSHESNAFGKRKNTSNDPSKMKLFGYHPDLPVIRQNYAEYADAVETMDGKVKATIDALKADGLYEETIIIYNSDHGGVMPRSKRFLYAGGVHCPLIVRFPEKYKHLYPAEKPGMTVDRMVSFVDMPKTWLSLAGADIPNTYQGTIFLGRDQQVEPNYHFAFRERADGRVDHVRMIRGKRFAYHKNYYPFAPAGQHLAYMWKMPATPAWEKYHREGKSNATTGRFFEPRVSEEFYDNLADFDNIQNLIESSEHQEKIAELRAEMRKRQLELRDSGLLPEVMRERRATSNKMTIYEMVRNDALYPLAKYLDAADRALLRDKQNLAILTEQLGDPDEGMRWWAIVGLHLLDKDGAPAKDALLKALADTAPEVRMMAAWTLIKLDHETDSASAMLDVMLAAEDTPQTNIRLLHNVLDWMGDPALPLVKKYIESGGNREGQYGIGILGRIAQLNGW
ncbi:MAG: N-sulfoglucosamine sulfohydrolase [Verrucomicrobiales bacterium]|jgi:N-sulfoglucosamine sulfohydrolase